MPDIGFVAKASVFNSVSGTTTIVPMPAGVAEGHRVFVYVGSVASVPTLTAPAGWQKLAEYAPGSNLKTAVFYKDVTAEAEPASYTWSWSASGRNWGYAVAYSGCDLTQVPTAVASLFNDVAAGAAVTSPAQTLAAGDWLITLAGGRENPGTDTAKDWTNAEPLDAERFDLYSTNTGTLAKSTAAWWDSNRKMPAAAAVRSVSVNVAVSQFHVWSVRLVAVPAPTGGGDTGSGTGGGTGGSSSTDQPIAFVGKAYAFNSTSGLATVVPVPTGVAQGHRMIAFVGSIGSSPVLTGPEGWLKVAEYAPGSTLKTAVFYRDVPAGAEPASYTWSWSTNGRNWGYIGAYSGVNLTQPPTVDSLLASDAAAGVAVESPALGLAGGDWLVTCAGGRENPGTDTAKGWTNGDAADATRLDFYSANTGTAAKTAAAMWDSARALATGAAHRSIAPLLTMAQVHLWSVRLVALLGSAGDTGGGPAVDPTPVETGGPSWSHMGLPLN